MGIIEIEGALSDEIMNHLSNWDYNDDTSDNIDQLTLTFNASRIKALPSFGTKYKLSIHGASRGEWVIVGSSITTDDQMTIKLSTVAKASPIKQKYTRAFTDKTIKQIVATVVAVGGYSASVDPDLGSKVVTVYQKNESAGVFLNRLASEHDAVSKPYNGVWMFKPRLSTTTSKGNEKPTVFITSDTNLISGTITHEGDKKFNGVKVSYWDEDENRLVVIEKGDSPFNDRGEVSKIKAQEIINSYTSINKTNNEKVTLVLPSTDPETGKAFAEGGLSINYSRFFKGQYIIDSISMNPTTTTIQASLPK